MGLSAYGPESQIKVEGDEFPDIVTNILVDDRGQPRLFTAYGELAGNNLMEGIDRDPYYVVKSIRVVDYTCLSMAGIAGLMPKDEFVRGMH